MKRLLILATVVAMALAMVPMTGAFANGHHPKTTGGASDASHPANPQLSLNAHKQMKKGATVYKGQVEFRNAFGRFHGTVTCYEQAGNESVAIGEITKAEGNRVGDTHFKVDVLDNGQPNDGPADRFRARSATTPFSCALEGTYPAEVTDGNLKVH